MRYSLKFAAIILSLASITPLYAINLDDLSKEQFIRTSDSSNFQVFKEIYSAGRRPTILGRSRKIKTEILSGAKHSQSALIINAGSIKHSQDAGVSAISTIIWDGSPDSSEINYLGLRNLNLLQDKSANLVIKVANFDAPASAPVTLELQIYSDRNSYSFARETLSSAVSDKTEIRIPFNNLQKGGNTAADLSKVGAIALIIYGLDPSIDLEIISIATDTCPLVPDENQSVVDICGICNGDGKSCLDCLGQINGSAKIDRCGVCNGNGQSCLNCNSISQADILAQLDNSAKIQSDQINQIGSKIIKYSDTPEVRQFVRRLRNESSKIQQISWQAIWTIPQIIDNCTNTSFCSLKDFSSNIETFLSNSQKLKNLSAKLLSKALSLGIAKKYYEAQMQKAAQLHQQNVGESLKVLYKHSICD